MNAPSQTTAVRIARTLLRISATCTGLGLLLSFPVLWKIGPWSLTLYFGLAQPALILGLLTFLPVVILVLRRGRREAQAVMVAAEASPEAEEAPAPEGEEVPIP